MECLWPTLAAFAAFAPVEWVWFGGFDEMMEIA
jgi:hypothetical protein